MENIYFYILLGIVLGKWTSIVLSFPIISILMRTEKKRQPTKVLISDSSVQANIESVSLLFKIKSFGSVTWLFVPKRSQLRATESANGY